GGFGYGKAKEALLNKLLEYFQEAREKRATLSSSNLDEIMNEGAKTAHKLAMQTMEIVYAKTGLK
ncbi:tryptophan--tRNA ligase, partial [Patescibacteria group bacterium]|nr:tryptophan--tRNA ligase [Patescibacteria group bacterium]